MPVFLRQCWPSSPPDSQQGRASSAAMSDAPKTGAADWHGLRSKREPVCFWRRRLRWIAKTSRKPSETCSTAGQEPLQPIQRMPRMGRPHDPTACEHRSCSRLARLRTLNDKVSACFESRSSFCPGGLTVWVREFPASWGEAGRCEHPQRAPGGSRPDLCGTGGWEPNPVVDLSRLSRQAITRRAEVANAAHTVVDSRESATCALLG